MTPVRNFVRSTWIGRVILIPFRMRAALGYTLPTVGRAFAWSFTSREHHNFTYELHPLNVRYLTSFVSVVTGHAYSEIEKYIQEVQQDEQLKAHLVRCSVESKEKYVTDPVVRFGRRIGWYAMVRAIKPKLCVETGTDKGLGTCVISAALMRNAKEGHPGKVLGMDINPNAGYLLQAPYTQHGELMIGDSHASIRSLTQPVDFFIHDSDHTPEHEEQEFDLIAPKLSPNALVLSDNSEVTDKLINFARKTGRDFLYFAEKSVGHWCDPSGIGVAFNKPKQG